ncbi:MAG: hypothetical protein ACOCT9_00740 [archaeon]
MGIKLKREEIIQIAGIVVTILVFLGTILHSNKKDRILQDQINHLDSISKQSRKQTKILREEKEFLYKQFEIKTKRRKLDIKPKLSIFLTDYDDRHVYGKLINAGNKAEIIKIVPDNDHNMEIKIPFSSIAGGKSRNIYFKINNRQNPIIDFKMIYEDIEGTRDTTEFQRRGRDDVFVRNPTKIIG